MRDTQGGRSDDPERTAQEHQTHVADKAADETEGHHGQHFAGLSELTESVDILFPLTGEALILRRKLRALIKKFRTTMRLARPLVYAPFVAEAVRMSMLYETFQTLMPESEALMRNLIEYLQKATRGMQTYLGIRTSDLQDLILKDIDGTILEATDIMDVFYRVHEKLEADIDVYEDLVADVQSWAGFRLEQIRTRARDAARLAMNG
ncbi:hypothetical protein CLCR_09128 [Cladophialophora carrionii]|uniref:Uncharacterized protein n=1 Tax=Cladophialophora carrionii TaxID=86049 RepID=A0A1C1CSA5_9EURO|nr:hypothetical protein CLCR_09128 [Cladophialophora carrionii]